MKLSFAVAALLGAASAKHHKHRNHQLFATGMVGNEPLDQDLHFDGHTYSFHEVKKAKTITPPGDNGCGVGEKLGKDGNCYLPFALSQLEGDSKSSPPEKVNHHDFKEAVRDTAAIDDPYNRTAFYAQIEDGPEKVMDHDPREAQANSNSERYPGQRTAFYAQIGNGPEKVMDHDPREAQANANSERYPGQRTAFYDKKNSLWREPISLAQLQNPEKVEQLLPLEWQQTANTNSPGARTTFYSQVTDEPEKVHVLEPEVYQARANNNKPNIRTTWYEKK